MSFLLNPDCNCCDEVECTNCSGTTPSTLPVTLASYAARLSPCNCPDLNATYTLDFQGFVAIINACLWEADFTWCSGKSLNVKAKLGKNGPSGVMRWQVDVIYADGVTSTTDVFLYDYGSASAIDCSATVGPITFSGFYGQCLPGTAQIN